MASDLSKLIEETLCSTLNGLLAKDAVLKNISKTTDKDLLNIEFIKIDSTYEFDNITSTWSYFIPAYTASLIFNYMIGDDSEPVLKVDDDIADAINEFISNVSGGFTTSMNGSDLKDLGSSKFTIVEKEIIAENTLNDINNMYKFVIDLEGKEISIFILFDKVILPFVEAISKSEPTIDEEIEKEEIEKEIIEDIDSVFIESEKIDTETKEIEPPIEVENIITEDSKTTDEPEKKEDSQEDISDEEKKQQKLKKVIIIIGALLGTTIILGTVMYFIGMFDPEPIQNVPDKNITKTIKTKDNVEVIQYSNKKALNFNSSMINERRLNAKLEQLTKYEILDNDEIERQHLAEKERLFQLEKERELRTFAAKNKEEDIFTDKNSIEHTSNNTITNEENKLKFVLVHSLRYKLYKELILKTNSKKGRISICKNQNGRTAVYIGPFENEISQNTMLNLLKEQNNINVSLESLTQEEFDTRCNFE